MSCAFVNSKDELFVFFSPVMFFLLRLTIGFTLKKNEVIRLFCGITHQCSQMGGRGRDPFLMAFF